VPLGQEAYSRCSRPWHGRARCPRRCPSRWGSTARRSSIPTRRRARPWPTTAPLLFGQLDCGSARLAAGSFDEKITFFGEVTISADGVEIEHARVHFNDLLGPKHLLNLSVGKQFATLASFGPHSSYVADVLIPPLSVSALYGARTRRGTWPARTTASNSRALSPPIQPGGRGQRRAYTVVALSNNVYAHAGYKLGGMRLDAKARQPQPIP